MILVTGATGLLGSKLLFDLAKEGKPLRAMKRAGSRMNSIENYFKKYPDLLAGIEWIDADVTDPYSLESALKGVHTVYHCAGKVSFRPKEVELMNRINIQGTSNLVNLCLDHSNIKLCHVSSVAALGRSKQNNHVNEDSVWKSSPYNSAYAVSKYSAEREVWRGIAEGLDAVIVNPGIIIGPGNWKTDSSVLFTRVSKGLSFYTSGITGFVDVGDVTGSMMYLMKNNVHSQRFIIVGENIGFKEVMDSIADELGVKRPGIYAGPFLSGLAWRFELFRSYFFGTKPVITKETARSASLINYYSSDKFLQLSGYNFKSIKNSIRETAAFFKEQEFTKKNKQP